MTIAQGIKKQSVFKKQAGLGVPASGAGGQILRRTSSVYTLSKGTFESDEIISHQQSTGVSFGSDSIAGNHQGLISPLTFKSWFETMARKVFAAGATTTALTNVTAATTGGSTGTFTRAAGSFLTDGVKIGDVIRLTAGAFNAANLNLNLGVLNLTATVATVIPLNGATMVAEGPIAAATVTIPGKRCWTPTSGHTDDSFSIEHWFSDVAQSEVFAGCKVDTFAFGFPTNGAATADIGLKGGGITTASAEYFTAPTAAPTWGVLHAVNGVLRYANANVANVTGLTLNYAGQLETKAVVGATTVAGAFPHMPRFTGQLTALFADRTYLDAFLNETAMSLSVWAAAGGTAAADFMGFTLSNVKATDSNRNDAEGPLEITLPFQALYNPNGGAGTTYEQSTLVIQDSQAV